MPFTYWVVPDRLLAGESPALQASACRARVAGLLDRGVQTFVDLTEPTEGVEYLELLAQEAAARGVEFTYLRFSPRDGSAPASTVQIRRALDALDGSVAAAQLAYLHCRTGAGRTGMVAGCYCVRQGLTPDAALRRLWEAQRQAFGEFIPLPAAQERLAREWADWDLRHRPRCPGQTRQHGTLT